VSYKPDSAAESQTISGRFQYKWVLFLVVASSGFLSIMNLNIVNIGAPDMIDDFQT